MGFRSGSRRVSEPDNSSGERMTPAYSWSPVHRVAAKHMHYVHSNEWACPSPHQGSKRLRAPTLQGGCQAVSCLVWPRRRLWPRPRGTAPITAASGGALGLCARGQMSFRYRRLPTRRPQAAKLQAAVCPNGLQRPLQVLCMLSFHSKGLSSFLPFFCASYLSNLIESAATLAAGVENDVSHRLHTS